MSVPQVALSLKQPWAALLVHGLKTIEVRRWSTKRRGFVLIHAAGRPDSRKEAWARLPVELDEAARLNGGIVGSATLMDCVRYSSPEEFAEDRQLHLNELIWYRGPRMYGFTFTDPKVRLFHRLPGKLFFFPITPESLPAQGTAE